MFHIQLSLPLYLKMSLFTSHSRLIASKLVISHYAFLWHACIPYLAFSTWIAVMQYHDTLCILQLKVPIKWAIAKMRIAHVSNTVVRVNMLGCNTNILDNYFVISKSGSHGIIIVGKLQALWCMQIFSLWENLKLCDACKYFHRVVFVCNTCIAKALV